MTQTQPVATFPYGAPIATAAGPAGLCRVMPGRADRRTENRLRNIQHWATKLAQGIIVLQSGDHPRRAGLSEPNRQRALQGRAENPSDELSTFVFHRKKKSNRHRTHTSVGKDCLPA
jgi:hypothetical protein